MNRAQLQGLIVIWDRGHGCYPDTGASGYITEEKVIQETSDDAIAKLRSLGVTVIEVRPSVASSVSDSLNKRCMFANKYPNAFIYVSNHANAGGGVGAEVYTHGGEKLPEAVRYLQYLVNHGFNVHAYDKLNVNAGIKDGSGLAVINGTSMRAMLLENCFIDTQADVNYYSAHKEVFANAMVYGITGVDMAAEPAASTAGDFLINLYGHVKNIGDMRASGKNACEIGTTGKGLQMEAFSANIDGVDITYDVHMEDVGDVKGVIEGQIEGSSGADKQLEGITIYVKSIPAGYKLQYRAHLAYTGWTDWKNSGEFAGTRGEKRAMEAVTVRIIKA